MKSSCERVSFFLKMNSLPAPRILVKFDSSLPICKRFRSTYFQEHLPIVFLLRSEISYLWKVVHRILVSYGQATITFYQVVKYYCQVNYSLFIFFSRYSHVILSNFSERDRRVYNAYMWQLLQKCISDHWFSCLIGGE